MSRILAERRGVKLSEAQYIEIYQFYRQIKGVKGFTPKRALVSVVIVPVIFNLLAVSYLYFNQRDILFHPRGAGTSTPADYKTYFEDVFVDTEDGLKLHGWWVPSDSKITLLYLHGNGATLSQLSHVASIFHSYGVSALLIDYRSYGRSEGNARELSEVALARDAKASLFWLRRKTPENLVVIWGHSLGSSVAAKLASENKVQGLVLEGAFTSIYKMARQRYPFIWLPESLVLDKFATEDYVRLMEPTSLLMLHAQNDTVIPLEQGQEVFKVANQPKQFLLLEGIDHNDFPNVHELYRAEILRWLGSLAPKKGQNGP